jgi:hypothetical protein
MRDFGDVTIGLTEVLCEVFNLLIDFVHDNFHYSTLIEIALIVLMLCVGCYKHNIRSASRRFTLIGFLGLVGSVTGVYCIATYLELNSLWPQFFLISGVIICVSSCCLIREANANMYFRYYEATLYCCIYPCITLLLFTTLTFIMSIISDSETTYTSLLYEHGMTILIWLAKYISAFLLCFYFVIFEPMFRYVNNRPVKVIFKSSKQVTEFVLSELFLIMKVFLFLGSMWLCYWLHSLVFSDEPYVLKYVLLIEVSVLGDEALTRLFQNDMRQIINKEGYSNTFAFFTSLLILSSGLHLIS